MKKIGLLLMLLMTICLCLSARSFADQPPIWWGQAADEALKDGYILITPRELKALYESGKDFLIVDARPAYEYAAGHLPRALNQEFDLGDRLALDPKKKEEYLGLLGTDKKRPIVIYCRSFR